MTKLVELRGQLDDRQKKLATVFEEAGEDYDMGKVASLEGDSAAKAAAIKSLNDEMTDLGKQIDEITGLDEIKSLVDQLGEVKTPPAFAARGKAVALKSSGERFVESDAYKTRASQSITAPVDMGLEGLSALGIKGLKVTVTRTSGIVPWEEQSSDYVPAFTRPLTILDIISSSPTQAEVIIYRQQNAFVNSAAAVAEGGTKPEGGFGTSRVTENVRKIAVWVAVTDEELSDVPGVRALIDDDLTKQVRQELEDEVLAGSGDPELNGLIGRAGVQTQAKGGDPTPDAIYKAMTKVLTTTGKRSNAVALHPNDWQDVKLLRTSDGIYIWGSPADGGPDRIWGVPVVQSLGLTENTGLVGDFTQAKLRMREELNIRVGFVNTQFIMNEQTILAEVRAALMVRMPAAFCKVTGI
jgi:HK97 family phage major capsid protein